MKKIVAWIYKWPIIRGIIAKIDKNTKKITIIQNKIEKNVLKISKLQKRIDRIATANENLARVEKEHYSDMVTRITDFENSTSQREEALQQQINSLNTLLTKLQEEHKELIQANKTISESINNKYNRLQKDGLQIRRDLTKEINYMFYKGLLPEQYEPFLKEWYKSRTGWELDLENPKTYNEKMQWLKLYEKNPEKTRLADKYLVREYVAEKIGEQYLIPLLGKWDTAEDIDFNQLPNSFVLKQIMVPVGISL